MEQLYSEVKEGERVSDEIRDIMKKYHDIIMNEIKVIREENKALRDEHKREINSITNALDNQLKVLGLMKKTLDEQTTKLDELMKR